MRKILLIEPDYKNKYPPIGLMKISTYHKRLGDQVRFFKGNVSELVQERRILDCIKSLKKIDKRVNWEYRFDLLSIYFKTRKLEDLTKFLQEVDLRKREEVKKIAQYHAHAKPSKYYDRIYVTTLFTFYWNITVKTIQQSKQLVENDADVFIGGVLASLLKNEIEVKTGIKPFTGLLDKPGLLDEGNSMIIDELPLDYSILNEIDYIYPTQSAYITFMTKGCTRKCAFCSVPKLEPTYKDRVPTIKKFQELSGIYGEQRNLLLMDNNVLASPRFPEIVEEIKEMGFGKGAKYMEPNQLEIAYKNLKNGFNEKGFLRRIVLLVMELYASRLRGKIKEEFKNTIVEFNLHSYETASKQQALKAYKEISHVYEKYRNKIPRDRYVDFNQGIDGRYVNEDNMKLLAELNVRPLRIAFDFIGMKDKYINAVELAAKNGIAELSNYILYNFKDTPEELYGRLKINVDLNQRLGLKIFSFPMKYIPLFGEEAKHRKYIGEKWTPKFIRTIQSILNATKGIVAPGHEFFEMAFGKDLNEYWELLYMPETFVVYRNKFEEAGLTDQWRTAFNSLTNAEREIAKNIIQNNDFTLLNEKTDNHNILELLSYYTINERRLGGVDIGREKLRSKFNRLIKKDMFIDLTLTYDYDKTYRSPRQTIIV